MKKKLRERLNIRLVIGFLIVAGIIFLTIFASKIAPHSPLEVNISQKFTEPNDTYWLGTDNLGRCVASRIIYGTRYSLVYSVYILVVTISLGVVIGIVSAYIGGKFDNLVMRVIDVLLAFPSFMVALAVVGVLGTGIKNVAIAMSLFWWTSYARLFRGIALEIKEKDFIEVAKAAGCTHIQIIFRHILSNMFTQVIVVSTLEIGSIILALAGFSFIGLGIQPPLPEWGVMLSDSREFIQTYPRLMYYPGIAIMITVMGFNLLGEGLKDVFN